MEKTEVENIMREVKDGVAVLLDVRSPEEYAEGHAVNALNFDVMKIVAGEFPTIEKSLHVYTYCKAGGRAEKAKQALESNGFANVKNIGGLSGWVGAGGEVAHD